MLSIGSIIFTETEVKVQNNCTGSGYETVVYIVFKKKKKHFMDELSPLRMHLLWHMVMLLVFLLSIEYPIWDDGFAWFLLLFLSDMQKRNWNRWYFANKIMPNFVVRTMHADVLMCQDIWRHSND